MPGQRPEHDRRGRESEGVSEPARCVIQRGFDARPSEQHTGELRRQIRLLTPLLGLARARPRELGHRARHDRGHEKHAERHPVAAVGDREAPRRREMEEVEGRRARRRS